MRAPSMTVGIEEEYQIIDPVTRDLTPGFETLVKSDHAALADIKAELHQCQVEIGTKVCESIAELRKELTMLRGHVIRAAGQHGLTIAAAGTHPFCNWMNQEMTPRKLNSRMALRILMMKRTISGDMITCLPNQSSSTE